VTRVFYVWTHFSFLNARGILLEAMIAFNIKEDSSKGLEGMVWFTGPKLLQSTCVLYVLRAIKSDAKYTKFITI
jgi:hypothetical protein